MNSDRRTTASSCLELRIRLEDTTTRYGHGDTVIGTIHSKAATDSPNAKLTLSIQGRSESRVETGGMGRNAWIGTLKFFDPTKTSQVLLSNQPLQIQSGKESVWPFAITIPSSYDLGMLKSKGLTQKQSFLPLEPSEVATQPLPPTYYFKGRAPGKSLGAFVEYYLQAELEVQRDGSTGTKTKTYKAIQPLHIEQFTPDPPIIDFKTRRQSFTREINSWRLIPGMEDAELSLGQKMRQSVGSSKVPRFSFKVHVDVPTTLQVGNAHHIPLNVGIEPFWASTSESIRDSPQKAKVLSFTIRVKCETGLKFRPNSFVIGRLATGEGSSKKEVLLPSNAVEALRTDIYIPCTANDTTATSAKGERTAPSPELVDIGELLNFNLADLKRRTGTSVSPVFTAHNIKHGHYQLYWELVCVLAGEEVKVEGVHKVDILPASAPYPGPNG